MKQHLIYYFFLVAASWYISGCEFYKQDDYRELYVIESYLTANAELPRVRVSHTIPLEEEYSFAKSALSNASVEIRLLNDDNGIADTFSYNLHSDGVYQPVDPHVVQAESLYELYVSFPNGDVVRSTTRVPGELNTASGPREEYIYQKDQVEILVEPSTYPGRQSYYVFTVNALEPIEENLTPFYRSIIKDQEGNINNFRINSSGIVNEGNYQRDENGNISLRLPWLAIAFQGPNDVIANAIDDNLYNFLRSQDVQTGGSTLPPGEIQNITYNVDGGIGIFGSMASDTNRITVIIPQP